MQYGGAIVDWKIQLFKLNYNELEKKAVSDVLDSGWITMGENIINFEIFINLRVNCNRSATACQFFFF